MSFLISVMFLVYRSRRVLFSHGKCLFEKGILLDGAWGFNDDDNFLFFNEMNLALIAPTKQTALRTMMRIHTAGAGNSLDADDSKLDYSRLIMNHEADCLLGQLVMVSGHHFRYDYLKIPLKKHKAPPEIPEMFREIALRNHVELIDEYDLAGGLAPDSKPLRVSLEERGREFGRMVYENFTRPSGLSGRHGACLFERGILQPGTWPHEFDTPDEFIFFRTLWKILICPSREMMLALLDEMDKVYEEHMPGIEKERLHSMKPNGMRFAGCESEIFFVFKLARAGMISYSAKDFIDLPEFIRLVRPLADMHGVRVEIGPHLIGEIGGAPLS
ncbi:MAG: hypothetical protein QXH42_06865 [Thermoplasmata archaeon]